MFAETQVSSLGKCAKQNSELSVLDHNASTKEYQVKFNSKLPSSFTFSSIHFLLHNSSFTSVLETSFGESTGTFDSGTLDSGTFDSGTLDSGTFDSGTFDSGTFDSGTLDSGTFDSGTFDSGTFASGTALFYPQYYF